VRGRCARAALIQESLSCAAARATNGRGRFARAVAGGHAQGKDWNRALARWAESLNVRREIAYGRQRLVPHGWPRSSSAGQAEESSAPLGAAAALRLPSDL